MGINSPPNDNSTNIVGHKLATERLTIKKGDNIGVVINGGPHNGPVSAGACSVLDPIIVEHGARIGGLYASSGSVSTAMLGCTRDYAKLCKIWQEVKPEDIVGPRAKLWGKGRLLTPPKIKVMESMLDSSYILKLLTKNCILDKIFCPEAALVNIPAVDIVHGKKVIASNRIPEHKPIFIQLGVASKGLVPFFQPQRIYDPVKFKLIEQAKELKNRKDGTPYTGLLLIDGGYIGNVLLKEAIKHGYDSIFVIDLSGFNYTDYAIDDINNPIHWLLLSKYSMNMLSTTNDGRMVRAIDRVNEEIMIEQQIEEIRAMIADHVANNKPRKRSKKNTSPSIEDIQFKLDKIMERMNNGPLSLKSKKHTPFLVVSNPELNVEFNFVDFTPGKETCELMEAGAQAARKTLERVDFVD